MKATLLIFVAVALVGCASPDLDNPQTLKRILAEAQVGVEVKTGWRKIAHANGKVSSLSHFKDGELDGLQTGWHENGKKRVQCTYKDGEKDGLWTVWDENGRKEFEFRYKDGEKEGLWTVRSENGRKEFEFCWKDGKRVGDWILYRKDGTKYYHVTYKDGGRVETIISPPPPSVPSCPRPETEPKELGKTLAAALAAMPEEYRKELAAMPEESRASVLALVKALPFMKREPVRLDRVRSVLMQVILAVRKRLQAEQQQRENMVRSELLGALEEAKGAVFKGEDAVMFFWDELVSGQSLEEQRKAEEDAQKRNLEKRQARIRWAIRQAEEKAAYGGLLVLNRIRWAKERGDTTLFLRERRITDVTPLAELTKLTELDIRVNKITDLTPLAKLTKLTSLGLQNNKITDLTPLAGLSNLTELHLEDNPIPLDQKAMLRKALPNCKIFFNAKK